MADTQLAQRLLGLTGDARKKLLPATHALHKQNLASWNLLLDAYEGSGGFLDGGYLWQYKREDSTDYLARREQARYHNFAKTIIGLYARYVLGKPVTRTTTDPELEAWWTDVDAAGTAMQAFMGRALRLALAVGHQGILADKTPDPALGPSRADERARPFLTLYSPQAMLDWRQTRHRLVGLKLAEDAPSTDILEPVSDDDAIKQYLIWTPEEWARFTPDGELVSVPGAEGEHGLGRIPFVLLIPEPSAVHPFVGQSLVGDANVHRALYNRCSEEDEVLRGQSFSLFVISVANADDVERIKQQFSGEAGVNRAIVTAGSASYTTPDQAVPAAIRANIAWLIQEIYRAAHVRFQRDSLDAESAEAIRLQHQELQEMLAGTAQACQQTEMECARLYYAWTSPTPEQAAQRFEAAKVTVEYPTQFFVRELLTELEEVAQAIALDLGVTFRGRLKKRVVRKLDETIDQATLDKVDAEIDAQPESEAGGTGAGVTDQLRANAAARLAALTAEDADAV